MLETDTQMEQNPFPYPTGAWKCLARAPLVLWRMGLGKVLGQIFVVITTRGRKSGLPRRAVTEYLPLRGKLYVPAAYAPRAQWYKNLLADPHVTVQTWQGPEAMRATRVTDDAELLAVWEGFRRRDWPMLALYLRGLGIDPRDPAGLVARKDRVYFVRFDPTAAVTPPPLLTDLVWVWSLVLGAVAALFWLAGRRRK